MDLYKHMHIYKNTYICVYCIVHIAVCTIDATHQIMKGCLQSKNRCPFHYN